MNGVTAIAVVVAAAVIASGCASRESGPEKGESAGNGFPATVATAYGEVTVSQKPTRIVALAPNYLDVLAALDLAPVAFETGTVPLADFEAGFPWLADAAKGSTAMPELLTKDYTADLEKIAALKPDLILASPWTVEQGQYDKISALAPTYVGASDDDSLPPWTEVVTDVGILTGTSAGADSAITTVETEFAAARDDLAGLQGKTYNSVAARDDGLQWDSANWEVLGLKKADNQGTFNDPRISYENLDQLAADVTLIGTFTPDLKSRIESDPRTSSLPAAKNGTLVFTDLAMANSNVYPGPHSQTWMLDQIQPQLEQSPLNRAGPT